MLDDLIVHLQSCQNQSLLARIYGMFSLKTNVFSQVDLIVMQNTTSTMNNNNPRVIFDLKGSQVSRYVSLPQGEMTIWKSSFNQKKVLKDLNFLEIENSLDQEFILLERHDAQHLAYMVENDARFLARFNIMDYSLLLGVEQLN